MLIIEKVQSEADIAIFSKLKIELVQYHAKYAKDQGINDLEVEYYDYERAVENIFTRESYLLKLSNTVIGILQFEQQISDIDNCPIIYVHALYFIEQYRNIGLGIYALRFLCSTYHLRIECSCWYNIPASQTYRKIGFKELYTRYFLPTDNRFYESDQN